jgi:hypothetical protein
MIVENTTNVAIFNPEENTRLVWKCDHDLNG